MVAKSSKWAWVSLVVFPPAAFALGLGDVRLLSQLNAPLDAEIELIGATPDDLSSLKAQLASRELFARYGLDWPATLGTVTMKAMHKPDGKDVIRVRSSDTVTEPFLTVLVQVNTTCCSLVREFTMLLDPPVFAPGASQANAPVAAPSTGASSTREGAIARTPAPAAESRPAPEPATSPAASEPPSASSLSASGSSRTVRPGDTLSAIANEVSGRDAGLSRAAMLAIYQGNPAAFEGNMNQLRSGAVLRIPEGSAIAAISPSEATAEIRRQYSAWRSTAATSEPTAAEPGRLRLVTPGEPGAPGANAGSNAQSAALQGRVKELEGQLQESRRLLEARNAELAQLQSRLSQAAAAAAAPPTAAKPSTPTPAQQPPAAAVTPPPAAEPPAQETPPAQATADETPAATPAPEAPPEAVKPARKPVATSATQDSGSIFDTLKEYWWAVAALVAVLLGLFAFKALRSRQRNEFDDSLSRLNANVDSLDHEPSGDTQPLRASGGFGRERESAFVVEESGTHERPRFGGGIGDSATPRNVPADDTISSETAINLDQ
ncbi:MAG TPA: FimV/HubP family polar landmark protein, partial [Steroidobacteraceae bacterium]|nr:FimV/HubP family polar landmark protein [Steroidobacteraceae bacterium]